MRGFTLLELLIVLAVFGLLAAIPVAHDRTAAAQLDAAARSLAADLESAREAALENGASSALAFLADGRSYALYLDHARASETEPSWTRALPSGHIARAALRRAGWIVFAPDGSAEAGGALELALQGERRIVRVHEASGVVWVTKP
ncbi:MAG: GspH/FimT family pseudopilin [Planctomycetes bacterium]|nr:GspH/FimT family pseudopilin [Planctomycetota bacterium]